jgi:predicted DNA-binding transcriptional regulator
LNKDRTLGFLIIAASLSTALMYGWLLFFSQWTLLALEFTCFVAIALVLGIISWIGYTLATTSRPKRTDEASKDSAQNTPAPQ